MKRCRDVHRSSWLCVLMLVSLLVPALSSASRYPNPSVLPPTSTPYGMTYGAWGAAWWSWAMSIPFDRNPIFDADGSSCDQAQSGPVWFLAGSAGGSVTRSCSVPPGKAVFFPIINVLADYPCPPEFAFEPAPGQSVEDFLSEFARSLIDLADNLAVEVDGTPLEDLSTYRASSRMFTFTGDPSLTSTFDACVTGAPQVGVSDGYWIMLAPLAAGGHTVHFSASVEEFGFSLDVTYVLQVGPQTGGLISIMGAPPAGGSVGAPSDVSLKALAQAAGAHASAATRQDTWGRLKILYR